MSTPDSPAKILVIRLGAMGDIIHALPAVAAIRTALPAARITWVVERKWGALLEGNRSIDRTVFLRRDSLLQTWKDLRVEPYDIAIDFQGLFKSAAVALASGAGEIAGFAECRERAAAVVYARRIHTEAAHVVDRNMDLARQALGCERLDAAAGCPIPAGACEGELPGAPFVLASPLAGWRSKQWPLEYYGALAARLREIGVPLVLDVPPGTERVSPCGEGQAVLHYSRLPGLIYATRQAAAVVGVDSGPLHLAAALGKPGVAIFGPTDPMRNGPYGESLRVLRSPGAATTYKRGGEIDESMREITVGRVFDELRAILGRMG